MEEKNTPNKDRAAFACVDEKDYLQTGLTKREYFAGQALSGLSSNSQIGNELSAIRAVKIADALLKELVRTEDNSHDDKHQVKLDIEGGEEESKYQIKIEAYDFRDYKAQFKFRTMIDEIVERLLKIRANH